MTPRETAEQIIKDLHLYMQGKSSYGSVHSNPENVLRDLIESAFNTNVTPLEANALLYAFNEFWPIDHRGHVTGLRKATSVGLSIEQLQALRDKLFAIHEHPERISAR